MAPDVDTRAAARSHPFVPTFRRVTAARRETHDTVTLTVETASSSESFAYRAGQFNMLSAFGIGEVPVSISGDSGDGSGIMHTVRAVGPVTSALSALVPNTSIGVRGPFGSCWPLDAARGHDLVLVGGGLGLAPLRSVIERVARQRDAFGRVVVVYGARIPDDLLFRDDWERWRAHHIEVRLTVDHARGVWTGPVGTVTQQLDSTGFRPDRTLALTCGPEAMMRFTALALESRGVSADRIFVSLERNMKCAVGLCGRCQLGPAFICKDGPVFPLDRVAPLLAVREL